MRRSTLCCTFRRLTPPGVTAPCPMKPGLSSPALVTKTSTAATVRLTSSRIVSNLSVNCSHFLSSQHFIFLHQLIFCFHMVWIMGNTVDRTEQLALRLLMMSDTLSTEVRMNFINHLPIKIASLGHTGSHTSQLIHSSVIYKDTLPTLLMFTFKGFNDCRGYKLVYITF